MNDEPRQALREIVAKYGAEICSDSRRCEGLLKDNCGSYRREISILVNALEEHVPLDLLAGKNNAPRELLLNRLAKRMEDNLALTADAAVWAVESWALALNVITDAEIAERENKRVKNKPQELDSASETKTQKPNIVNFPPNPAPQKQQPKQPTNQPPVFAPPPSRKPHPNIPIGNQIPQTPVHPVPAGNASPQMNQAQIPAAQNYPKKRAWKKRGCFIGCFLLLVLLGILAVGVPYTLRVMREAQQSIPPSRVPQQ